MSSLQTQARSLTLLEGCRAIAAILVVLYHAGGAFEAEKYFSRDLFASIFVFGGSAGVQFFFALSGFIITHVHLKDIDRPSVFKLYVWRRFVRIYPMYWIVFFGVLLISYLIPAFSDKVPSALIILKSLSLVPQDPSVVGGTGAPVLGLAWTMQYEMIFYSIFGLYILSSRVATFIIFAMTAWYISDRLGLFFAFPFHFLKIDCLVVFLLGVLAALIFKYANLQRRLLVFSVGFVLFAGIASNEVFSDLSGQFSGRQWISVVGYGLGSSLMILGLASYEQVSNFRASSVFQSLGRSSYVLYLMHFPMISLGCKILSPVSGSLLVDSVCFVSIVLVCVIVAHLVHVFVEAPKLKYLRSIGPKASSVSRV